MTDSPGADDRTRKRALLEAVLAAYPEVSKEETAVLIHWFRREASALDVGLIASDPSLAPAYRQLKEDHLDRLSGADLVRAFVAFSLLGAIVMSLVWRSL